MDRSAATNTKLKAAQAKQQARIGSAKSKATAMGQRRGSAEEDGEEYHTTAETMMPYVSEAQRKFMHAKPKIAAQWDAESRLAGPCPRSAEETGEQSSSRWQAAQAGRRPGQQPHRTPSSAEERHKKRGRVSKGGAAGVWPRRVLQRRRSTDHVRPGDEDGR